MRILDFGTQVILFPLGVQALSLSFLASILTNYDDGVQIVIERRQFVQQCEKLKYDALVFGYTQHTANQAGPVTQTQPPGAPAAALQQDLAQLEKGFPHLKSKIEVISLATANLTEANQSSVLDQLEKTLTTITRESKQLSLAGLSPPDSLTELVRISSFIATCSFLAAAVGALFLVSSTKRSLNTIYENCIRHANDKELLPPEAGIDELTTLDQSFRKMFQTVATVLKAEKDLLHNTQDAMFALDRNGRFVTANRSTENLIGKVEGKRIVDVLAPSNKFDFAELLVSTEQKSDNVTQQVPINQSATVLNNSVC
jgi:hypothetical protein